MKELVLFHADWAKPSKIHLKILPAVAKIYGVIPRTINVMIDPRKEVHTRLIQSALTVLVIEDKKELGRYEGNIPKKEIHAFLKIHFHREKKS